MLTPKQQQHIKSLFLQADALLITAGAGMGVDSGLPDFRGNQGMWQAYPALGKQRMDFTSIANPAAFHRNPQLAWGFYGHRLQLYRETLPHQGFELLQQLSEDWQLPYFIFTSNVDGQFQKAGFSDQQIYECHGSIHHLQCMTACTKNIWSAQNLMPKIDPQYCTWQTPLPKCPDCGGLARPNILMFNDHDWISHRTQQQQQRLYAWLEEFSSPLVIEIGAGTAIPTVRYFSERFAPNVIRINPREASFSDIQGISMASGAVSGIQTILDILDMD